MTLSQALAANLKRLRSERNLTQEDLATDVGIAVTYFGQIERARRNPTLDVVERLAACLGVDALSLLSAPSE